MARKRQVDQQSVFLNVPFDKGYERLFVALIASLVSVGRSPRCVLEIPEMGEGRLRRIQELMGQCRVSIHDLSKVGNPARFNMPFELGLACNLARLDGPHDFIILEKVPYRLDRTLSDIKGYDPLIHEGKPRELVNCILDALGSRSRNPDPPQVFEMSNTLWKLTAKLKRSSGRETVFGRFIFQRLFFAATELALDAKLIDS